LPDETSGLINANSDHILLWAGPLPYSWHSCLESDDGPELWWCAECSEREGSADRHIQLNLERQLCIWLE